ncbi:ribonucleoprotein, chloroplastic [Sesamum angolense]|uniref:Ribonucleoprotein, chloroplastic n=1 Tax=Sesamum angolense TaxID=2727404 RepID=A0AAE1T4T4_9LAMI|nr:ribonucleoprotein, chloroplastic [Sesamum angolense]
MLFSSSQFVTAMALGAKEAAFSVFSSYPSTSFIASTNRYLQLEEEVEESGKPESRRKLFVLNLPWSFSVADIKKLFGECGTVADVEIIKQKDGKNRGFAFVTMSSGEEAQGAIEKYDSYELVGRIIRVQFAKRFKKPVRASPVVTPPGETRHKLYVSNLAWKVRSNNLRDLFSSNFNPVSVRVVFDNPSGRSAGIFFLNLYRKVVDGIELLGRPIRLKFSEKNTDASESKEEESSEQQPENASKVKQKGRVTNSLKILKFLSSSGSFVFCGQISGIILVMLITRYRYKLLSDAGYGNILLMGNILYCVDIYLFLFPSPFMTLLLNDNGQLILFYDTIRMLPCSRCCQHGVCHSMVMSTFLTRGWRPSFALPVMGRHNGFRAC